LTPPPVYDPLEDFSFECNNGLLYDLAQCEIKLGRGSGLSLTFNYGDGDIETFLPTSNEN
jgi:hypothetical protein